MSEEQAIALSPRAVALLVGEIKRKAQECESRGRTARGLAKRAFSEGKIACALDSDKTAEGQEVAARELRDVLWRFKCWQGHSSTPNDELPFPI